MWARERFKKGLIINSFLGKVLPIGILKTQNTINKRLVYVFKLNAVLCQYNSIFAIYQH